MEMSKFVLYLLNLFLIFSLSSCLYPKIIFDFESVEDLPPSGAEYWIDVKDKYPQEILVAFRRVENDFNSKIDIVICVDKQYKKLLIKKMKFIFESNQSFTFIDNVIYDLPDFTSPRSVSHNFYYAKSGYYWTSQLIPINISDKGNIDSFNLMEVFGNKKVGDTFEATLEIVYQFDEDPEKTEVIHYKVEAVKNKYASPLLRY